MLIDTFQIICWLYFGVVRVEFAKYIRDAPKNDKFFTTSCKVDMHLSNIYLHLREQMSCYRGLDFPKNIFFTDLSFLFSF